MNPIPSSEVRGEEAAAGVIDYFRNRLEDCSQASPYRRTASGAWAASRPEYLFSFFKMVNLSGFGLFIDLGAGDGVACCVAGLFTRALGIESDPLLAAGAGRAARHLHLQDRVGFICADFLAQSIGKADCLYVYPDKPIYAIENALEGWGGTLLVYGPHFPPKRFSLKKKLRLDMETMSVYSGR
ncbi:MAG: hypothetical protein P4L43_20800 [Syntrophobacteraceae bacterium]|nr:hypothetical protein [Syntrophobacteraceae bacterium]